MPIRTSYDASLQFRSTCFRRLELQYHLKRVSAFIQRNLDQMRCNEG